MMQKALLYIVLLQLFATCCMCAFTYQAPSDAEDEAELKNLLQSYPQNIFNMLRGLRGNIKKNKVEERAIARAMEETHGQSLQSVTKAQFMEYYENYIVKPCNFFRGLIELYAFAVKRLSKGRVDEKISDIKSIADMCKRVDRADRYVVYLGLRIPQSG